MQRAVILWQRYRDGRLRMYEAHCIPLHFNNRRSTIMSPGPFVNGTQNILRFGRADYVLRSETGKKHRRSRNTDVFY